MMRLSSESIRLHIRDMPTISLLAKLRQAATFSSYEAGVDSADIYAFGKRNLIYGFNGCGKTTLSRVFAYLGTGLVPTALPPACEFEFTLSDGTIVRDDKNTANLHGRVVVYNEDFIEANFNWQEGTAQPVQLGAGMIADVKRLEELQEAIEQLSDKQKSAATERRKSEKALSEFCRETARNIEQIARLPVRTFTAPQLTRAYASPEQHEHLPLSDLGYTTAVATINQAEPPRKLRKFNGSPPDLHAFALSAVPDVLATTVPEPVLPGFAGHESQRFWLQEGYEYHHTHDLESCLLCANALAPERYQLLASYFSDAINTIASKTRQALDVLARFDAAIEELKHNLPEAESAAPNIRTEFAQARNELLSHLEQVARFVDPIRRALNAKAAAPASAIPFVDDLADERATWCAALIAVIDKLTAAIAKQDNIADQFALEQETQRMAVKHHLLAQAKSQYDTLSAEDKTKETALKTVDDELAKLKTEYFEMQAKMRDHALAAAPINTAIANFLRHKEILVEPVDKGYLLRRADGTPVVRLSEGEKTAVTFCYFVASLLANNRKKEDLIVVVDDPISSLDTRALNYMAALIKAELGTVRQLFVLTHNLPFMSEMRKWIAPASLMRKASDAKRKNPPELIPIPLYQIHVRQTSDGGRRTALISNMHALVRDYESEYHFLYSVVHTFAAQEHPTAAPIYLLPNAIRKVLETFLSFKVPGMQNLSSGLDGIKGRVTDKISLSAIERFAETESHGLSLSALVEPSQKAVEEAHVAARALLRIIEQLDNDHAKAMRRLSAAYPALG